MDGLENEITFSHQDWQSEKEALRITRGGERMKHRNPEATCATCPYWKRYSGNRVPPGGCRRMPAIEYQPPEYWCGEHPDFFLEETPDETT